MMNTYNYVAFDTNSLLEAVKKAYSHHGIVKYDSYLEKCYNENNLGIRKTIIALKEHEVVGIAHLVRGSRYPYFNKKSIPEISDLVVFEPYRKHGIASKIIEILESHAKSLGYDEIGICVGLYKDYGSAQKLYSRLGYTLDGNGLVSHDHYVNAGQTVLVDDDLNICFTKKL